MKKQILSLLSVSILIIFICYIVVNFGGTENETENEEFDLFSGEFIGANETTDNPWNTTAGVITLEDSMQAVYLTPNTQYEILTENNKNISFDYVLFEQVRNASDGATLSLEYFNDKDEIVFQEVLNLTKEDSWLHYTDELDNITKIRLSCGNGANGDDTADWIMIREPITEINQNVENNANTQATEVPDGSVDIFSGEFIGANETTGNPWNTTAGIISLDDGSQVVFLTPKTQYEIPIGDADQLSFSYMLNEQVSASSDGAALIVEYLNDNDEVLSQEVLDITKDDIWLQYMDELNNISKVRLGCGNGANGDDTADWVIIRR